MTTHPIFLARKNYFILVGVETSFFYFFVGEESKSRQWKFLSGERFLKLFSYRCATFPSLSWNSPQCNSGNHILMTQWLIELSINRLSLPDHRLGSDGVATWRRTLTYRSYTWWHACQGSRWEPWSLAHSSHHRCRKMTERKMDIQSQYKASAVLVQHV